VEGVKEENILLLGSFLHRKYRQQQWETLGYIRILEKMVDLEPYPWDFLLWAIFEPTTLLL